MRRFLVLLYGALAYGAFLATFLYAIGFVTGVVVPKTLNSGADGPLGSSILINVLLLGLFAVQHMVMARPWFKARWTKIIPKPIERSTFVLATCVVLGLIYWQWRPMPATVWSVTEPAAQWVFRGLFVAGWLVVLYASLLIDHFDLFGMRQVFLHWRHREYRHPGFALPWLYRLVRNPLMLGFIIAVWATPTMTYGHLLFSAMITGYVFVGVAFEERDLARVLGEEYRRYRARTPMLFPWPRKTPSAAAQPATGKGVEGA